MSAPFGDPAQGTSIESTVRGEAQMSTYRYQPLPGPRCIRVLDIELASWDPPIKCRLETVSLDDNPEYRALSYSWGMNDDGDASFCRDLQLDGCTMPITRNLFECIKYIRSSGFAYNAEARAAGREEYPLRLWVDAVCINQKDVAERNAQVAIMASIYTAATQTIIWLGARSDDPEILQALIKIPLETNLEDSVLRPLWNSIQEPIEAFLARRYFNRRWIVQEVYHSDPGNTVVSWDRYGMSLIELRLRMGIVWSYHELMHLTSPRGWIPGGAVFDIRSEDESGNLLNMLDRASGMDCSDDRDRLYSMLSIQGIGIQPDYARTTAQVYTSFACYLIEQGRFDLLFEHIPLTVQFARGPQLPQIPGLPSWCPDLRRRFTMRSDVTHFEGLDVEIENDVTLVYSPFYLGRLAEYDSQDCSITIVSDDLRRWKVPVLDVFSFANETGGLLCSLGDNDGPLHVLRSILGEADCYCILKVFISFELSWNSNLPKMGTLKRRRFRVK